jgi:hypothetical protein
MAQDALVDTTETGALFGLHAGAVPGSSPAVVRTRTDTAPHKGFAAPACAIRRTTHARITKKWAATLGLIHGSAKRPGQGLSP